MCKLRIVSLVGGLLAAFAMPLQAADTDRISGPLVHGNLAIYLVHGNSSDGPVPLTLEEALLNKTARVHETNEVNVLEIENVGDEPVFVQSGDIVKGGQQDRALTASLLLPPRSGRTRIDAFCVEHGRWSSRGNEDPRTFASARSTLPSRQAKVAIRAPSAAIAGAPEQETHRRQAEVWRDVAGIQQRLSGSLGAPVPSPRSQTSLQLALENEELGKAEAEYVEALQPAAEQGADVVGYVFAINGKLNSADVYPSNGLFRKMWPKLIRASATEAIGESNASSAPPPSIEAVASFLGDAERGTKTEKDVTRRVRLETRESKRAYYFETKPAAPAAASQGWIHRNYLAK